MLPQPGNGDWMPYASITYRSMNPQPIYLAVRHPMTEGAQMPPSGFAAARGNTLYQNFMPALMYQNPPLYPNGEASIYWLPLPGRPVIGSIERRSLSG